MNLVIRGIAIYLFIVIVFRFMGKRALNEMTTFDFVLLLIISEVTQEALVGEDFSLTASAVLICTLMGMDILFSILKSKFKLFDSIIEGAPLVIVDNGKLLKNRMKKSQVEEADVLEAARLMHGLERMDEIKYAVLEKDGSISIIPQKK